MVINTQQFLEIGRKEPQKLSAQKRQDSFGEIYQDFSVEQAIAQADRCLDCGNPYCQNACPVHNYIPNWLQMVAQGEIEQAARLAHQTSALPEVCGRVCPQDRLCELACTLENTNFEAVTIGMVEKFLVDFALENDFENLTTNRRLKQRVAIVGAGPAGLACADRLSRQGVGVVVYEAQSEIGGLLTFGIPNFKLEKEVMLKRRQFFEQQGIEFKLNCKIGEKGQPSFADLEKDFDAVFLGMGTYKAMEGGLKGEGLAQVYPALDYLVGQIHQLFDFSEKKPKWINLENKKVIVLGGGDTAMDCNRTAIRQKASQVICAYRRDEKNMPGSKREVKHAKEEGVQFVYQAQPVEILSNHQKVTGVRFAKTELHQEKGSDRQSVKVSNETFEIEADCVIIAFGFGASPAGWFKKHRIETDNQGLTLAQNPLLPYQSKNPKVFTGGDMYRGSSLVVDAIADGQKAGDSIAQFLQINT